jgi:hypothetical protein
MALTTERKELGPAMPPAQPGTQRRARRPGRGWSPWPTWATLCGWPLLFLARRVLDAQEGVSKALSILSVLMLLAGFGLSIVTVKQSPMDRRPAARVFAWLSGLGLGACALYFATTDWGRELLHVELPKVGKADTFGDVLTVTWITLVAVVLLGTLLGELARLGMRRSERVESRRVVAAVVAGAALGLCAAYGAMFTFASGKLDWSVDFSFFRTARPSDSTRKMIDSLDQPLKVLVFFPQLNEVGKEVDGYLRELGKGTDKLQVESYDRLLVPDVAKENNVRKDGVIVLVRDKKRETLEIGTELDKVTRKLKNLDGELQKALLKVIRGKLTAYLTVGHGELNEITDDKEGRTGKTLKANLEGQHYDVKDLGLAQGLASDVPDDATVVMVLGPKQPFMPEEIASLKRYLARNGHLLLALDPDDKVNLDPLAEIVGLKWEPALAVNDKVMLRRRHNDSDKAILVAKRFSSHAAVSTLSKLTARGAAVLFPGAADLQKRDGADSALKIDFAVKGMPGSYLDLDGSFTYEKDKEKQITPNLVAVVSREPADAPKPKDDKDKDKDKARDKDKGASPKGPAEMRAFVIGDVDCLSDLVLDFSQTNLLMFLEAVRWLGGEESFTGEVTSTEDIEIVHTKNEDQIWFYASIVAVPAAVLGAGLWLTLGRRRTPKRTAKAQLPPPDAGKPKSPVQQAEPKPDVAVAGKPAKKIPSMADPTASEDRTAPEARADAGNAARGARADGVDPAKETLPDTPSAKDAVREATDEVKQLAAERKAEAQRKAAAAGSDEAEDQS